MEADILLWIQNNIRNDVLTPIFRFITTLGNAGVIWIVLSVGLLIPKKTRRVGALALVSLVFSALIDNVILKNVVARTRPYEVIEGLTSLVGVQKDYSFPSGHTGSAFAAAVVMGLSRLYVGVHYPSDVLGGALIGTGIALFTYWFGTVRIEQKA